MSRTYRFIGIALCLGALASIAHAQATPSSGVLDDAMNKYQAATAAWQAKLLYFANSLFWILAGIEFLWVAITLGVRQADLQEWVADLVRWILITGLFWAILQNGTTWIPAIINSFRQAGDAANQAYDSSIPGNISPSSLLDTCLDLAAKVCDSAGLNPIKMVFVGLFGLTILIAGALIGMMLVCAVVEMYIVVAGSMLLLGFGGSRWTRDYATKALTYAVSVGVKLMVMQLLIGLGERFINDFASAFTSFSVENVAPIIVALVVLCGLVRSIPNIAQSMVAGVSIHTGGGFGAAMAAAQMGYQAARTATAAATGVGGVAAAAGMLAAQQTKTANPPPAGNLGIGKSIMRGVSMAGGFAGRAVSNVASAAAADARQGLRGRQRPHTTIGQRMTDNLRQRGNPPNNNNG